MIEQFSFLGFTVYRVVDDDDYCGYWIERDDGEGMRIREEKLKELLEQAWSEIF